MAKKTGRRYADAERAAILADMERNGLTQVAAAKKHGVSEGTLWKWRTATRRSRPSRQARARGAARQDKTSLDGLADLVRAQVREQVKAILPGIIKDEVARAFGGRR